MATFKKLKSGNWNAQIRAGKIRESRTYPTKREAEAWATMRVKELRTMTNGGDLEFVPGKTVRELFEMYRDRVSPTKEGGKWEVNRINRSLKEDAFVELKCMDIRSRHIVEWIHERQWPRGHDRSKGPAVSGSSIQRDKNLYNPIFNFGIQMNWMVNNPFKGVTLPAENPPRDFLYTEEMIELVRYQLGWSEDQEARTKKQKVCVAFMFALETAMRLQEICQLTEAKIRNNVAYIGYDNIAGVDRTKTGVGRAVPLSKRARELLTFLPETDGGPMFGLKSSNASALFTKYITKRILPDAQFRDTRHYACTHLAKKLQVLDLAKMTGHTDLKILLKVYYNANPEDTVALLD